MSTLTVVILTLNEERNLPKALESVQGIANKILVVDSFSQDRTIEIARQFGAEVRQHAFETHAKQWNWAIKNLPAETDWILALDADQALSEVLSNEIADVLKKNVSNVDGYYLNRKYIFCGKWIRWGGYYPKYLMKLFRNHCAVTDEKELLDSRFYVASGKVGYLKGDLIEENHKDDTIQIWMEKHKQYAFRQAKEEVLFRRFQKSSWLLRTNPFGSPDERVLWWKSGWYWMPRFVRPFLYFFYRYIIRLGFLDGRTGTLFHGLQAFWYRWLVDVEIGKLNSENTRK